MSLRIGLVTGEYPPMEGGVGAFTQELAKALHALGHEIFIISSRASRPVDRQYASRELNQPIDVGYAKLIARGRKWAWNDMHMVADIAIREELDIVNIQYQPAAFNMRIPAMNILPWRMRGVAKTVVTFHDLRTPYLFPKAGPLRQWVVKFMARHADGVVVTNREDENVVRDAWHINRVQQIPIGSNIEVHAVSAEIRHKTRTTLGLTQDDILLGYFGFLNDSKGADTLIDALAKLPENHHLVFIGGQTGASDPTNNSAFLNSIHAQINGYGLQDRVHWTGFVDDAQVSAYLKSADLITLPYKDGVSLRRGTLMATLAHGCPLITTQGDPELKHGENCWLISAENANELTLAVKTLTTDYSLRENVASNAQTLAQSFTWDKIAQQTLALYKSTRQIP
ncbi:MAG: glycosyltransferase family 4 protein [Candidatus Promineifilaceae bacterium]